jgi:O-antigen/teichoic acid export membrane protein
MIPIPRKYILLFVSKGLTLLSSMLLYWAMAAHYETSVFGVFSLGMLLGNLLGNFSDFGINTNGPALYRKLRENGGLDHYGYLQFFRFRLSVIVSLVYALVVIIFYRENCLLLLCFIPFLIYIGSGFGWMFRQINQPEKILYSSLIMLAIQWLGYAVGYYFHSFLIFVMIYGFSGWLGLIMVSFGNKSIWKWSFKNSEFSSVTKYQAPMVLGHFISSLHGNLFFLLYAYMGSFEELGNFQAHWILYTSCLSFGLIVNDIFSSFDRYTKKAYGIILFTVWFFGILILGGSWLYFDWIFSGKGYQFNWHWMLCLMVLFTVEIVFRIGGLQQIAMLLHTKEYLLWNVAGLVLQGAILGLLFWAAIPISLMRLLWMFLATESILMVLFYFGRYRNKIHETI